MSITESEIRRRDLLKKGVAAGAAFWAVPVIDSITSRAAAGSPTVTLTCAQIFVFYKHASGTVEFTASGSHRAAPGLVRA